MRAIEDCSAYEPDIKKVTTANSFVASGRVVYIVAKYSNGKDSKYRSKEKNKKGDNKQKNYYYAYDRETKIQLGGHWDKEYLINFLIQQDLSCLGGQQSLF